MVPAHLIPTLATDADAHINTALHLGAPGQQLPILDEPGYVAATVLGGIPMAASAWQRLLVQYGIKLSVVGVFCHQSPQVKFTQNGNSVRCELADLLVVVDDLTELEPRRTAILVQAKMAPNGQYSVQPGDRQFHLYSTWTPFEFTQTHLYRAGSRDFQNSFCGCTESGTYGLISNGFASAKLWHQCEPAHQMSVGVGASLGSFLASMLGAAGQKTGRCCSSAKHDDWSETVDELLRITATQSFSHRTFYGSKGRQKAFTRETAALLALSAEELSSRFPLWWFAGDYDGDGKSPPVASRREEERGISTVRFIISR